MSTDSQKNTVNGLAIDETASFVVRRSSAIGNLPKQSILERVVMPGKPVAYRVRRDIVISAARHLKLENT